MLNPSKFQRNAIAYEVLVEFVRTHGLKVTDIIPDGRKRAELAKKIGVEPSELVDLRAEIYKESGVRRS